jgi:hypothetical protein
VVAGWYLPIPTLQIDCEEVFGFFELIQHGVDLRQNRYSSSFLQANTTDELQGLEEDPITPASSILSTCFLITYCIAEYRGL